jgi:hypothetical protein
MFTVSFTRCSRRRGARRGELPEESVPKLAAVEDLPESVTEMIWSAQKKLDSDPEAALLIVQKALQQQPNNAERTSLLVERKRSTSSTFTTTILSPQAVPHLLVAPSDLSCSRSIRRKGLFLSSINGSWDIQSILSICPFREADCLRMIRDLLKRGIIGLT